MDFTCICLTHGRQWLLEEAVESFRRQNLGSLTAELIIVNDCPEQRLTVCNVPGVRIIEYDEQFEICCEKYNAAFAQANGEWLVFWDDDDISLPYRLGWLAMVAADFPSAVLVKPTKLWNMAGREINGYGNAKLCHGMVRSMAVMEVGGGDTDEFIDQSLCKKLIGKGSIVERTPMGLDISYIYRWDGIPWHDSFLWDKSPQERARLFHEKAITDPRFKAGNVVLHPHWEQDYVRAAKQAAAQGLAGRRI